MRFLFHFYDLETRAGIQRAICELSNALVAEGHEVFIASATERAKAAFSLDERVALVVLPHKEYSGSGPLAWLPKCFWALRQWRALHRLAARLKPSMIVDHGTAVGLLYPFVRMAGAPFVLQRHFPVAAFPRGRILYRLLACFKSTAEVVALTGNVAEELRSCGFRNVHVIPNMISSEARPSPYLLLEPRIGLLMGRAGNPQKGFDIFLEALALRPIPGWKFRIVGPCADTDPLLRELVERHHLQAVVALLPVSSDPCGCIRQCSCVIMPSRYEALPMVALEALAMGRPLLASDADGLKNVVVDGVNGRVFAHSSAAKLAECLAEVCPDDESLALFAANAPASVTRFGRAAVLSAWLRYADSFAFVWR